MRFQLFVVASAASSLTAVTAALASAVTSSIIANNEALDTIDMAAAVDASTMASVAAAVGVDETLEEIIANDAFVNVDSNNIGIDGHFDASLAPRRVLLSNNENLSDIVKSNQHIEFEIEAVIIDDDATAAANSNLESSTNLRRIQNTPSNNNNIRSSVVSSTFLHVSQISMPITSQTTFAFRPGRIFNKSTIVQHTTVLASNPSEKRAGVTTLLSINTSSGKVKGLQRGQGGIVRQVSMQTDGSGLQLRKSSSSSRRSVNGGEQQRNFTCGVAHRHEEEGLFHRHLLGDDGHHHHHEHDHEHEHEHDVHTEMDDELEEEIGGDNRILSGIFDTPTSNNNDTPLKTTFQINIIIDIDAEFIRKQGGPGPAVEYINFLVSAANVIFENELDAHLNIIHIEETTIFDNLGALRDGLRTMRETHASKYESMGGADGSSVINLRHALLGRDLGGGIAFIDTICDSSYGFGLSSGLVGTIGDLDEDAMYDVFMFSHEVGHSLGSDHTFEYTTPIDTCQINSCPEALPLRNSATIMSYCNFCSGGLSNIALTLGGIWDKARPNKQFLSSWKVAPEIAGSSVSKNPKRVSHKIWSILNSKGECIRPPPPTSKPTFAPTQRPTTARPTSKPTFAPTQRPTTAIPTRYPTRVPTSKPTTSAPTTSFPPTPLPTASKKPSPAPTKTPIVSPTVRPTIAPPTWVTSMVEADTLCTSNCFIAPGIMFDVGLEANSKQDSIMVTSVSFEHTNPSVPGATMDIYASMTGSYIGSEKSPLDWVKVGTVTVPNTAFEFEEIILSYPIPVARGEKRGFYLVSSSESVVLVVGSGGNYQITDDHGVKLGSGSASVTTFGGILENYSWGGKVGYKYSNIGL